jgi:ribosomal protein S18 acetylase RimI-like enzyme
MVDVSLLEQVVVRHVRQEDLPALEWEGEYRHFRRLFTDAYRRSLKGESILWIADLAEVGVIGQLFIQLHGINSGLADGQERAYIYGFRVRPEYRGEGVGSLLLTIAENDLRQRGFIKVALNVGRDNPDARRLYERFGYRVVSAEPGVWSYLDDQGRLRQVNEPAWRMEKQI